MKLAGSSLSFVRPRLPSHSIHQASFSNHQTFGGFPSLQYRFLATLFAFSKTQMSLPVARYFEQKQCCFQVHASQRDLGENGPVHPLTPISTR